MSERREAQKVQRREEIDAEIAAGRLTVRQMTPAERARSDAYRAEHSVRKARGASGRTSV